MSDGDSIELLFLGTGTSAGVPMIACDCETCTSTDPRDKRNRCAVVLSYHDTRVLIDTPPELRLSAIEHGVTRIDHLVFTHGHADHVMGLDDVRRFNAVKGGPIDVWASEATHVTLDKIFGYAFRAPDPATRLFRPHLVPRTITGPFEIGGKTWTPVPLLHGSFPVLGFRIGDLAYCTDVSRIEPSSMDLLRDLDILVLDALQHRSHSTHFTVAEALEVVRELRPRRTYFTHIAHGLKHDRDEPLLPDGVKLAYDGLIVRTGE